MCIRDRDYIEENLLAPAPVLCKGYVAADDGETTAKIEEELRALKENAALDVGTLEVSKREVDGDAWLQTWKEHFRPFHIGEVVVCPCLLYTSPQLFRRGEGLPQGHFLHEKRAVRGVQGHGREERHRL